MRDVSSVDIASIELLC